MKIIKEIIEGYPTARVTDDKYSYTYDYYSNNSWVDDDRIILKRYIKGKENEVEYVLVDIKNETEEVLKLGDDLLYQYTDPVTYGE